MSFNAKDYVSAFVTEEEVLDIKKAFDYFDRDLGGAIDPRGELTDDTILQDMIERADDNKDGVVAEEEFYNLVTKKAR
ncbi:unnamed protein product [Sphagnum balticum]